MAVSTTAIQRLALTWIVFGGVGALGAGPASQPVDQNAAFTAECLKAIDSWKQLPLLPACGIGQVVQFSESQGLLLADWPLIRDHPLSGRLSLTDLPGVARIQCMGGAGPHPSVCPMFEYYDFSQPGLCRHLQILCMPSNLQVVQDWESVHQTMESVSLLENFATPTDAPVTLRVQLLRDEQPAKNLVFSALTLDELRRDHPDEFEQYLRPLFHDFHQEVKIFWMDDRIAWQVLADEWHGSAEERERVMGIVARLNAPDFAEREQAQKDLRAMGQTAALVIHGEDRSHWTPEQVARTDKFMAAYFTVSESKAQAMGQSIPFLLNCLGNDDRMIRAAALSRLDRVLGRKIEYNVDQSPAERRRAVEQLRRELSPEPANASVPG